VNLNVQLGAVAQRYSGSFSTSVVGVGEPLKSFSVAVRTPLGTRWLDEVCFPSSDRVWSIVELTPAPSHVASVAVPLGAIVEKCTDFLE